MTRPSESSRKPLMQLKGSAYSRSIFEIVRSGGFCAAALLATTAEVRRQTATEFNRDTRIEFVSPGGSGQPRSTWARAAEWRSRRRTDARRRRWSAKLVETIPLEIDEIILVHAVEVHRAIPEGRDSSALRKLHARGELASRVEDVVDRRIVWPARAAHPQLAVWCDDRRAIAPKEWRLVLRIVGPRRS